MEVVGEQVEPIELLALRLGLDGLQAEPEQELREVGEQLELVLRVQPVQQAFFLPGDAQPLV
jgi:hypothetical protein